MNDTATLDLEAPGVRQEPQPSDASFALQMRLASWLADVALSAQASDEVDDAA